jgi:hypothetical protein
MQLRHQSNSRIHRLITAGTPQEKAIRDVDTIDRDRAAFVRRYLKLDWPELHLYDVMVKQIGAILCC